MEGYSAAREGTAARRLPHSVLVLRGSDSQDFLDRTVSNELPSEGEARRALLLTPEGRTRAILQVFNTGDGLVVLARSEDDLKEEWESNIFVEDVEVDRGQRSVFTVQGPGAAGALASVLEADEDDLPSGDPEFAEVGGGSLVLASRRSPAGGYDVAATGTEFDALLEAGAERLDAEAMETLRVEAGVPGYRNELLDRIPLAAGLRDALSFDKCYTGQEVVARVEQRAGGADRWLAVLEFESHVDEGVSTDQIEVTTAVESPRYGDIGLGFVDTDASGELSLDGVNVKVREHPFEP